jgi:hypothetical protein
MAAATIAPAGTARAFSSAMLARDFGALAELLADDVIVRSPITSRFIFEGREQVIDLLRAVRDTFEDLVYSIELDDGKRSILVFSARVGGHKLEGVDVIGLDDSGKVSEMTVFVRPLPGITTLAAELAPRLARRRSRMRSLVTRILVAPLVIVNRIGDAIGARLVGPKG